jgi:hypothetical protein
MYKNAEGYRDETAWLAIMAVMKEERKHKSMKELLNSNNKTGEIWNIETTKGEKRLVLAVADYGPFATVLYLGYTEGQFDDIVINSGSDMSELYANSRRLCYVQTENFESREGYVSQEEYRNAMKKIADTLGITDLVETSNRSTGTAKPETDKEQQLREQLAAANAKADAYQNMCNKLFERTM